jgi:hypothetical protein
VKYLDPGRLILAFLHHAPPPDAEPLALHPAIRKTRAIMPALFADRQFLAIDHVFLLLITNIVVATIELCRA